MTEFEFYKNDPVALAEKINLIKDTCAKHKFDLSEAIVKFLCGEHIDITGKVERDSDTTVAVNVSFIFNLHGLGAPSDKTEFETAKGYFEQVTKDVITYGTNSETVKYMRTYSPDDITFGETQIFNFGEE